MSDLVSLANQVHDNNRTKVQQFFEELSITTNFSNLRLNDLLTISTQAVMIEIKGGGIPSAVPKFPLLYYQYDASAQGIIATVDYLCKHKDINEDKKSKILKKLAIFSMHSGFTAHQIHDTLELLARQQGSNIERGHYAGWVPFWFSHSVRSGAILYRLNQQPDAAFDFYRAGQAGMKMVEYGNTNYVPRAGRALEFVVSICDQLLVSHLTRLNNDAKNLLRQLRAYGNSATA